MWLYDAPGNEVENLAALQLALECHGSRQLRVFWIRTGASQLRQGLRWRPAARQRHREAADAALRALLYSQHHLCLEVIEHDTDKRQLLDDGQLYRTLLFKLRMLAPHYLYVSAGCRLLVERVFPWGNGIQHWQQVIRQHVREASCSCWVIFPHGNKCISSHIFMLGAGPLVPAAPNLVLEEIQARGQVRIFREPDCSENDAAEQPFIMSADSSERSLVERLRNWLIQVYLPHGYPHTVTQDYLAFTLWRLLQNTAASVMGVFSTEALLLGLGLGKNVSGTAQAVQWILKDGFGHAGKIAYAAVAGKQFDMDPRSWRIMSDLLEDLAGVLEIITPIFSGQFLVLASIATTMRAIAAMTGTATRHAIFKSMALAENQGDLATKGESQGVTTKLIGLGLGITLSKRIGQDYTNLLIAYGIAAVIHLAANFKAMQCVEFSTLNRQRMALLLDAFMSARAQTSRQASRQLTLPTPREICANERFMIPPWRDYRSEIVFGASLQRVKHARHFLHCAALYRNERYIIYAEPSTKHVLVFLRDGATVKDQLKAFMNAQRYLLDRDAERAYNFTQREFSTFLQATVASGWSTNVSLLNPTSYRIRYRDDRHLVRS